jgi:D-alanine-D-alanine ligase
MPPRRNVLLIFNRPGLGSDHAHAAAEAGVLEAVAAVGQILEASGQGVRCLPLDSPRELARELARGLAADVVFNLCEGFGGRGQGEAQAAAIVEAHGLPLTGCPADCLALVRDKVRTKWLLAGRGLPTPQLVAVDPAAAVDWASCERLLDGGPVIVKPAREDASLGLGPECVVTDRVALAQQVARLQAEFGPLLVERFVVGREFNVGVVEDEPGVLTALPIAEIEFAGPGPAGWHIVDYDAKWKPGSAACRQTPVCSPARLAPDRAARLAELAVAACRAAGCRGYARVDFRWGAGEEPMILEVNGNPDLSPSAGLARALNLRPGGYREFVQGLVEHAAGPVRSAHDGRQPAPGRGVPRGARLRPLSTGDVGPLVEVLLACGVFRPDEVAVGREVLEEALAQGPSGDYQVTVAELDGELAGWECHGLVPMTDGTYDLYWIAVHPKFQGSGLGRQLVEQVRSQLGPRGARWLLAETSAAPAYGATRVFYERAGFLQLSEIPDFYRVGDGRVVYGLRLDGG